MAIIKRLNFILSVSILFFGCATSTQLVRNEKAEIEPNGEYRQIYFIQPEKDPRNLVPRVVQEFETLGFDVKLVNPNEPIEGAQGTGFFVSDEYHILTCAHVMEKAQDATVWVGDRRFEADVLSVDEKTDLSLLRLRAPVVLDVTPVSFRYGEKYRMGEDVFTIGFPISSVLGNNARLSKGLVSSTSGLKDDKNQLQISTEIQPGNSGGPLFDRNGVVLGVVQETLNPWKMAQHTGGALPQNVNFAIKSDIVVEFLKAADTAFADKIRSNEKSSFDEIESAVVKVKSGIIPEELENMPKLVATLDYLSFWDMWFRFRYFVVSVYDFDSQELLFRAGQGHDNPASNENAVVKDTFEKIRMELKR